MRLLDLSEVAFVNICRKKDKKKAKKKTNQVVISL
jgi:hypothetical protein